MSTTYLDPYTYQKMPTGLITTQYIGNQFRFSVAQAKGVSALAVTDALTTDLRAYDNLYIFDQLNSEVVQVASDTAIGATSIPLIAPTQYAHASGTPVCSDGASGSLAQQIFTASQWIEDICHQSLYVSTYTGEVIAMPTMRASIDNEGALWFRPRHFPIVDLTAISIRNTANVTMTYDATQAIIDAERQLISIPNLAMVSGGGSQAQVYTVMPNRNSRAWITITYDSGYSPLPWPIQRACSLLTNQCFTQLYNAIGADTLQEGGRNVTFTLRGDQSGVGLLVKESFHLLQPYIVEAN